MASHHGCCKNHNNTITDNIGNVTLIRLRLKSRDLKYIFRIVYMVILLLNFCSSALDIFTLDDSLLKFNFYRCDVFELLRGETVLFKMADSNGSIKIAPQRLQTASVSGLRKYKSP